MPMEASGIIGSLAGIGSWSRRREGDPAARNPLHRGAGLMLDWLPPLDPWHWLVLGLVLAALELTTPAFLFLPMGIGGRGHRAHLGPLSGDPVVGSAWRLRRGERRSASWPGAVYLRRHPIASDEPTLNRRGHQYVGRVFTLDAPIVNGVGKIRVDDSTWKVVGPDVPAGVRVRVSGVDGTVLQVEVVSGPSEHRLTDAGAAPTARRTGRMRQPRQRLATGQFTV